MDDVRSIEPQALVLRTLYGMLVVAYMEHPRKACKLREVSYADDVVLSDPGLQSSHGQHSFSEIGTPRLVRTLSDKKNWPE